MQVDITADQVDFRLSTPRTSQDMGDGSASQPADAAPPAVMSLIGITLQVVDPLVPASYDFDRVRCVMLFAQSLKALDIAQSIVGL